MGIGQLRKWTDTSAPSITGANYGELDALFQAVLVDGYGSQAALGWTTTYSDTNRKVFQNASTGSNKFLRVDHSSASADTRKALVSAYEVVSDVDTGQLRAPTQGFSLIIRLVITTTGATPWMIIGDELGFWFCWRPHYVQYPTGYGQMWYVAYFGDYIPADVSNMFNFIVSGDYADDSYGIIGATHEQTEADSHIWALRDYTCEPGSVAVGINSGSQYESGTSSAFGRGGNVSPFTLVSDTINGLFFTVPTIHGVSGKMLGWLPGCLNPLVAYGDYEGGSLSTYDGEEYTLSDRVYHLLRYRYYNSNATSPHSICLISGEGFRDVP